MTTPRRSLAMLAAALTSYLVSSLTFCNTLCRHRRPSRIGHTTTQLQSSKVPAISTRKSTQTKRRRRRKHYYIVPCYNETNTALLNDMTLFDTSEDDEDDDDDDDENNPMMKRYLESKASPFPTMPSSLFSNLAQAQFELLSNSLVHNTALTDDNDDTDTTTTTTTIKAGTSKISSMALYLPKENSNTGQLEFVPAVTYPNPSSERVFIASDSSNSGIHQPPVIPSMAILGLPGFFQAKDLIPTYPFVSPPDDNDDDEEEVVSGGSNTEEQSGQQRDMMFTTASPDTKIGVSVVEEIPSGSVLSSSSSKSSSSSTTNTKNKGQDNTISPLSVTLFSGMETLGVLMIWPNKGGRNNSKSAQWKWSSNDKLQVSRAAKSLALALSMDKERVSTQISSERFHVAMADSLHQVKSPLQALRTFGKLLQRQLAEENSAMSSGGSGGGSGVTSSSSTGGGGPTIRRQRQLFQLAENMAAQGERVVDLIEPMDMLVNSPYLLSGDVKQEVPTTGMVLRSSLLLPNGSSYGDQEASTATTTTTSSAALEVVQSSPVLGDFQMELAFPQDVLGSTVYASQMVSREKGINFDAVGFEPDAELPACLISSKQLQEAVSNVLDNAIKYVRRRRKGPGRPRIPQVKVSITANESPLGAGCTIWVEDNGPGIPEEDLRDRVFERGFRSSEVRDEVKGSGLGLTVAKFWLEQMGGRIELLAGGEGPSKLPGTTVRIILFRDPEI